MIQRVQAPSAQAPGLPGGSAPHVGGTNPINLRQAADQIGGLNLFGDEGDNANDTNTGETPANQDGERKRRRGADADRQNGDNDQGSDDETAGNQDTDGDESADDQTGDDDVSGQSEDQSGDTDSVQDADSGQDAAPEINTLSDLAEALEVDVDFLADLQDSFKADGDDVTVTLAELRSGYQRDANYRRQTQELAQQRQQLEQAHSQRAHYYQQELARNGMFLQQGEQLLIGQLDTAEMQQLRQANPAEWAARREELGQRINEVRNLYAQTSQQFDAFHAQQNEQSRQQLQELRQNEANALRLAIPEWGEELNNKLTGYLDSSYGFKPEELNNVFDSRLVLLANKARLYDEMQAVSQKTKKKVTALPKVQKPGKQGSNAQSKKQANYNAARKKLAKSGKLRDAAAALDHFTL